MKRLTSLLAIALSLQIAVNKTQAQDSDGNVITVKMVDLSTNEWRFEPAEITVHLGDTVRWVQEDVAPHNVEFREWPENADLGDIKMGTFLLAKGDVYELVIDETWESGQYVYVCTPHAPMGMKATMFVMMQHNHEDQ